MFTHHPGSSDCNWYGLPTFLPHSSLYGSTYNAYTQGFGRHGFIVVNSGTLDALSPEELVFVIGHEMGHVKRFHTTWLTLLSPGRTGGARFLFAPLMEAVFNVWSVKAEYTADQAALIACDDIYAASRALLKLSGGSIVEREVDLEEIVEGGKESDELLSSLVECLRTHPFIQNRVRHLWSFVSSDQYRSARWWRVEEEAQR